jgi:hypothetical protein
LQSVHTTSRSHKKCKKVQLASECQHTNYSIKVVWHLKKEHLWRTNLGFREGVFSRGDICNAAEKSALNIFDPEEGTNAGI